VIPAWVQDGDRWKPCWVIGPAGDRRDYVMIAYDDKPQNKHNKPLGSLAIDAYSIYSVRIRRTPIPVVAE